MNKGILKSALISEKSFKEAALGKFTFIASKDANKEMIAEAVKGIYDVDILDINIINVKGKVKRTKKGLGKRSDFKKAILTLKKGQKIDLFEVEKEEVKGQKSNVKNQNDKAKIKEDKNTKVTVRDKRTVSNRTTSK